MDNPRNAADFRALVPDAPLPWQANRTAFVVDANGQVVCETSDVRVAGMVVVAVNTCGGYRAELVGSDLVWTFAR